MEPEGSLPHSQEPATCPCPQSTRSSPYPTSHLLKIHLNIIPSTPGSPKWPLSVKFPPPEPRIRVSSPPRRGTCPAYLIRDLITRTILGEEYRLLSFLFCSFLHSPVTSSFLGPNIPQHPILKHPQPTFRPQCEQPSFTPVQNNREDYQYEGL